MKRETSTLLLVTTYNNLSKFTHTTKHNHMFQTQHKKRPNNDKHMQLFTTTMYLQQIIMNLST